MISYFVISLSLFVQGCSATSRFEEIWKLQVRTLLHAIDMEVPDVWMIPTPHKESSLNKVSVNGKEIVLRYITKRPRSKPLVTVSNHYSMVDDFLFAYILPWTQIINWSSVRWVPAAQEIFCRYRISSLFFQLGRVIPVSRGTGVYQYGMDFCSSLLNNGEWVHIYPEGRVNRTKDFTRIKWGVGRLIAESKVPPVVLPLWHVGMENVYPTKKPYYPRLGKKVTVVIGDPIDFEDDLKQLRKQKKPEEEIWRHITDTIQNALATLKTETEMKHDGSDASRKIRAKVK